MIMQDFVVNEGGRLTGFGEFGRSVFPTDGVRTVASDPGLWQPYIDPDTRVPCVTINSGRQIWNAKTGEYEPEEIQIPIRELRDLGVELPVQNASPLEKDQWIKLDNLIVPIARQKLRAWADLSAASPYGGFDGMAHPILEHQTVNDPGEALEDMDGLSEGRNARRIWQLEGMPLPIKHVSFSYNKREMAIANNRGRRIETQDAEAALRRLMEKIEGQVIGNQTGMIYGDATNYTSARGSRIWGYSNYPDRATGTLTTPTGSNPQATVDDVLEMRDALYDNGFDGPYILYVSKNWDRYLDNDYAFTNGSNYAVNPSRTLRSRLKEIDQIQDVRRLSQFTGAAYQMLLVQMTSEVAQAVNGMDITAIQWQTVGGLQVHYKWMCIMAPRILSDQNGQCGVAHFTT